jgi:hypothetical protein
MVVTLVSRERVVCAVEAVLLKDRELFELMSFVSEQKNRHIGDVVCEVDVFRCVMIGC